MCAAPASNGIPSWMQSRLGSCLAYAAISICITFFNKGIFSFYSFRHPGFMITTQICFSLLFLIGFRAAGIIHFDIDRKHVPGCLALATVWCTNVLSGIAALQFLSVPMWSTLRRLTTLLTLVGEVVVMGKRHPPRNWMAVGMMVGGALVAGMYDLEFNQTGYMLILVNDVATTLYLILVSRLCDNKALGTFGVLFYMNVCSLPMMLIYCATSGEFTAVAAYPMLNDTGFRMVLILGCMQAFFINIAQMICTQVNSPVTTSVTGQLSKVVTIAAGFVLFTSSKPAFNNVLGVALGLFGGLYYARLKILASPSSSRPPPVVTSSPRQRQAEEDPLLPVNR